MTGSSSASTARLYHLCRRSGPLPHQWTEIMSMFCDDETLIRYLAEGWAISTGAGSGTPHSESGVP